MELIRYHFWKSAASYFKNSLYIIRRFNFTYIFQCDLSKFDYRIQFRPVHVTFFLEIQDYIIILKHK